MLNNTCSLCAVAHSGPCRKSELNAESTGDRTQPTGRCSWCNRSLRMCAGYRVCRGQLDHLRDIEIQRHKKEIAEAEAVIRKNEELRSRLADEALARAVEEAAAEDEL